MYFPTPIEGWFSSINQAGTCLNVLEEELDNLAIDLFEHPKARQRENLLRVVVLIELHTLSAEVIEIAGDSQEVIDEICFGFFRHCGVVRKPRATPRGLKLEADNILKLAGEEDGEPVTISNKRSLHVLPITSLLPIDTFILSVYRPRRARGR